MAEQYKYGRNIAIGNNERTSKLFRLRMDRISNQGTDAAERGRLTNSIL